jgi:hypothetical protein
MRPEVTRVGPFIVLPFLTVLFAQSGNQGLVNHLTR